MKCQLFFFQDSEKPGAHATVKKIFVGGIKDEFTDQSLRDHFGKFGSVELVEVCLDLTFVLRYIPPHASGQSLTDLVLEYVRLSVLKTSWNCLAGANEFVSRNRGNRVVCSAIISLSLNRTGDRRSASKNSNASVGFRYIVSTVLLLRR